MRWPTFVLMMVAWGLGCSEEQGTSDAVNPAPSTTAPAATGGARGGTTGSAGQSASPSTAPKAASGGTAAASPPSSGMIGNGASQEPTQPAQQPTMPGAPDPGSKSGVDRGMPPAGDPDAFNPYPGYVSDIYADDTLWMCKPDLETNHCLDDIVDVTEVLPDGSRVPFTDYAATTHSIDCVYWYPTVNRNEEPTSLDFSDPTPQVSVVRSQAARFSRVCNVFAPLYRQASLNRGGDEELGFSDTVDGFKHYIANLSQGRDFVILGHSQGTSHAIRLIQQEIDGVPELRARMISALLIGGRAAVPVDAPVGGSFQNVPLCERPDQYNCTIAYRSYSEDMPPSMSRAPSGQVSACTHPGALGGGAALFKGAFFGTQGSAFAQMRGTSGITTPWVLYRDLFEGECMRVGDGDQFLAIRMADNPDDQREAPVDFSSVTGVSLDLGLHVLDFTFPEDDLIDLVGQQAAAKAAANP
jgi:hypothetical protein